LRSLSLGFVIVALAGTARAADADPDAELSVEHAVAVADEPSVRLEVASGWDSNVTRVEDEPGQGARRADGLVRTVLELQDEARPAPRVTLAGSWHLGAKHFFALEGEDGLYQRAEGTAIWRVADALALRLDGHVRDRSTRDPEVPRDFTDFDGGPGLEVRLGRVGLAARAFAGRFLYEPDDTLSSRALGGSLRLACPVGPVTASAGASFIRRDFDGPRLLDDGEGGVVVSEAAGERRRDDIRHVDARVDYVGAWIGSLEYAYEIDDSNSAGAGFGRHVVTASVHAELPLGLLASGEASLQRIVHADRQHLAEDLFVEDEDRSSVSLRLERPLFGELSLVGHASYQFSPADDGPAYGRQLYLIGVAYGRD
jgi:hypothetical protein